MANTTTAHQPPTETAPPDRRVQASLNPIAKTDFGYEQARHLLWRAGFGGTPAQIQTLVAWGPEKSVDHLLEGDAGAVEPTRADQFDKDIMRPLGEEERRAFRAAQRTQNEDVVAKFRKMRQDAERADRAQMNDLQKWWLKRMIETPRPLEEKMTLFWHGLFATNYRTIENSYHMFLQNGLFRTHAVGNYGELLFGIIRDPAMLAYLDNNDSRKGKPNENLAREIMELFSLGVGNYTEKDIKEGARALTGYTFEDDTFAFQQNNHDKGNKTILGQTGPFDGDEFVKIILEKRACGHYIARRVYGFFTQHLPPAERLSDRDLDEATGSVVRQLAGTLLNHRYNLKPMLRQLLLSKHFYDPGIMGQQIKSPAELVVGAVRSLNTPVRDLSILNDALDLMGQSLFYPPSVKGWEGGRSWINTSTLYVRQNIMAFLLTGKKPVGYDASADTQAYDPTPLLSELSAADPSATQNPALVARYLLKLTIGQAPPAATETLVQFVAKNNDQLTPKVLTGLLLLITSMPEYQLC